MNFQQLRIVRETVRRGFNLTEVAQHLHTSQSGVSKHIRDLEDELGGALYLRKGKRLLGLTALGQEAVKVVERMLLEAHNLKTLAEQYHHSDRGQLTIATTHTQARYILPSIVTTFKQHYPKVHLRLLQGSPTEIVKMLLDGDADIGLATEALSQTPELVVFPMYSWHHSIVVPVGHPLVNEPLTLDRLAHYPIITYHEGFTGRARIEKAFADAGLVPDVVISALDADVIKSYVELGLGVGIIASVAFLPERDSPLVMLSGEALFSENQAKLAIREGLFLKHFAYQFIQYCSPNLTPQYVAQRLLG